MFAFLWEWLSKQQLSGGGLFVDTLGVLWSEGLLAHNLGQEGCASKIREMLGISAIKQHQSRGFWIFIS